MWRFRRILAIQRTLERAVEERTEQLLREQAKVLQEKKNVEDQKLEIERLLHESQRAMEFKSQFLANMSHEIRTPMNGIIGLTELTLDTALEAEQRNNLQLVRSSAKSLLSVINNILDFSKVEAGKLELENIDFDLRDHLNNVVAMLAYSAREKHLALTCKIDGGVPDAIVGDSGRLRQILVNLIGNAIKFTDQGEVVVHVSEPRFADEPQSGENVLFHFAVKDTGIGIVKEQQGIILEPFRQADESVTRKYGGTGLGLAICNQLVALMDGRMWLESEVGKGTTFHFTARFKRASARKPISVRDSRSEIFSSVSRSLRILVAEDNRVNQKLMTALLQRKGHMVTVVESGREAATATQKQFFDLVLMDMQMPEMDGFEATSLIREREKSTGRHLRIIAITASAMVGDRERCLAAGLDDYLAKPINAAELYNIIDFSPQPGGTPPFLASAAGAEETATPGAS
jgi:signal transduction histidine kinase/CheY-like chemotaxis protein